MTTTFHLDLPYIAGSQAQKHVTHNDALSRLDAAVHCAVLDRNRMVPPSSPADGDRHIVAAGASGAWTGHAHAIAFRADGVWDFLEPRNGWCVWSVADDALYVFDGTWQALHAFGIADTPRVGINTTADETNRLAVRSNAALLQATGTADGGSGDIRLQMSREDATKTASVFFSDDFSGRAEFGLTGASDFKLKTSADGMSWCDALAIDTASGNAMLPRGLSLSGVVSPSPITADANDYAPSGHAAATVFRLSSDAARTITGLAGGQDGRIAMLVNTGGFNLVLSNGNPASGAANRFALTADVTLPPNGAALLWYDGTSQRWRLIARN